MLKWLLRRQIDAFGRSFDYDVAYMRDILDTSASALMKFSRVMGMAEYHEDVPLDAWYTAKLVGTLHEDCGPCTQLVVDMATRAGVKPESMRSVLAGKPEAMPEEVALAFRYARASLAHDLAASELREQVVKRWGKKALVSLAFAVTSARIFPTLKYALGHGHTCTRVRVAGVDEVPAHAR